MNSKTNTGRTATILAVFSTLFALALAADAKMPGFDTDVEVDGTTATVIVTFEMEGFNPPELERAVAIYPSSKVDDTDGVADHDARVDVTLTRTASGMYQGVVDLEKAGSWAAVSMPDLHGDPAFQGSDPGSKDHIVSYPDPVYFETGTDTSWGWVAGGAVAALALGVLAWRPSKTWKQLVAVVGVAGLVLLGTAATPSDADSNFECPVTIPPQPGFLAPEPEGLTYSEDYQATGWPREYPHEDMVWYGSEELWTALAVDGDHGGRKSVWWSVNFPGGGVEEQPDVSVTWTRLDTDRAVVIDSDGPGTNAFTAQEGWFMMSGVDPDLPGCWRVTAEYKGATLSYVYERS
ncbi:MAG: hypothetical protein ACLFVZ_01560 [Actinomycetota bacterium]